VRVAQERRVWVSRTLTRSNLEGRVLWSVARGEAMWKMASGSILESRLWIWSLLVMSPCNMTLHLGDLNWDSG
jgi:hypothetical protein